MLRIAMLVCVALFCGCAFHSTARDWNGLAGQDGEPAYYKSTTKVTCNFLVILPFIGDNSIDGLIDDLTREIAAEKGGRVRIVQGSTENYWYGFPPFTWIVTPVISTVAAEYTPDKVVYAKDQAEIRNAEADEGSLDPTSW